MQKHCAARACCCCCRLVVLAWCNFSRHKSPIKAHHCLPLQDTLPGTWVNNDTWSNLTTLRLVGGGLLSMPLIWGMQALTHLDLSRNNLTGPLPAFNGSGGIAPLEQLDLSHNALAGGLPPDWGTTLPSLSVLLLSANQLNGTLPTEVRGLHVCASSCHCMLLSLTRCCLHCVALQWGSSMTTLTWLDLSSNRLAGPLPGSWNQMGSLVNLTLSHNNFTVKWLSTCTHATQARAPQRCLCCACCRCHSQRLRCCLRAPAGPVAISLAGRHSAAPAPAGLCVCKLQPVGPDAALGRPQLVRQ